MAKRVAFNVASDHPAFAGHFPAFPILPGVVLVDAALHDIEQTLGLTVDSYIMVSAKFLRVVRPGESLSFEHERLPNHDIRFEFRRDGQIVAHGLLRMNAGSGNED